jgi:hypothetical protein
MITWYFFILLKRQFRDNNVARIRKLSSGGGEKDECGKHGRKLNKLL